MEKILKIAHLLYNHLYILYRPIYFLYKQFTDRDEIRIIRGCVRRSDTVLDIGANIGFHARLLASIVGSDGKVYSFEPSPLNYQRLLHNTRRLTQILPVQAAIGSRNGATRVYLSNELNVDDRTYATNTHMPSIEVQAIRLDEYIPESSEVTFVKIDIQGSEVHALQGMRRILSGSKRLVVICECSPHALHQAGSDVDTLMDTLQSAGLTVKVLDRKGLCDASSILRDRRRWNDPYYYSNLIAYNPSQQILMEEICGMVR